MESFIELARRRRSMRKFTDEPLTQDEIRTVLTAGLMAPSSKGKRSPEYVVVQDKATLAALADCKEMGSQLLAGAAAAIVVVASPEVSDVWVEDTSAATMMMLLAAEDLGLGSCWVQARERDDAEANVRRALGIPADRRVLSIVALGRKGMERKPQSEDRLDWTKVHAGQW